MNKNSFGARATLRVGGKDYTIYKLEALEKHGFSMAALPYSIRVLLESVLRREDGVVVTRAQVEALARWNKDAHGEFAFVPARVLLQDLTGVPVVADLAAMRDAIKRLGGNPARINPIQPVDLVIDHSVHADVSGTAGAFAKNSEIEFARNHERYLFLRWGQHAFNNFRVVPPDTGIVHQVNLEYLAPVVFGTPGGEAYPDTVVGTDSHTTMINGLGVVGWGVGGIEAEAAMLGRSIPMLIPEVVGFRLSGALHPGATATDLVLTVTQMLRKKGVVNKFVEYFGPGMESLSVADRATLANMSPEYGATIGFFPVDNQTLKYLRLSGRSEEHVNLVEAYCKAQGLFHNHKSPEPTFTDTIELDLGSVEPSLAGPRRPQDRVALAAAKGEFRRELAKEVNGHSGIDPEVVARWVGEGGSSKPAPHEQISRSELGALGHSVEVTSAEGARFAIGHGSVIIAAITSLHQHLESIRDARRRPAREESRRARAHGQAVGQDQPRAGLESRHAVSQARRVDGVSGATAVQSGRLRMHHLYRQQRPDRRGNRGGGQAGQSGRLRGVERQSQFRGPYQSGGALQLSRLAAAGGRLRDRGHDGYRSRPRAAGHRHERQAGLSCTISGRA